MAGQTQAGSGSTTAGKDRLDPALVKPAVVMLVGVTPVLFDSTIVNVAIDALAHGLHSSVSAAQWTISGYLLALGMAVPIAGWAMERFGAKAAWQSALALFMAGSILASLAWNMDTLIIFRALQGLAGGLLYPILANVLVRASGGRNLGRVAAALSLPGVLGPILGPVIGGVIVADLSWRWVFWINVPIAVVGLILAWRGLEPGTGRKNAYLDLTGLFLLSPALATIIFGFTEVGIHAGFDHLVVVVPLTAGVALLAVFVFHALRTSRPALVDMRLFTVRTFAASTVLLFVSGVALYGALLLLPLYYQSLRGKTALDAGLLLAPQGLGMLLTRTKAGKLTDRVGSRPVVLGGLLLMVIGTAAYTQAGTHPNEILLGLSLVVRGAGFGAVTIPLMATAYIGLRREQIPHASAATRIAQQVGGSFGAAITAVIIQAELTAHRTGGLAGRATAFNNAFWWTLALTAFAVIPALALPRHHGKPNATK